jgi:hypothetical protein
LIPEGGAALSLHFTIGPGRRPKDLAGITEGLVSTLDGRPHSGGEEILRSRACG